MDYKYYAKDFQDAQFQHNIMAIVGNGFDIQALQDLGEPRHTRYTEFYDYLNRRGFDQSNLVFMKMAELRASGHDNWSDVENAIAELAVDRVSEKEIRTAIKFIQLNFSEFLSEVARPEVLMRLGERSAQGRLATASLGSFLGDITDPADYNKLFFAQTIDIGSILNFHFVNLNYTTLLDDYIYLDDSQFEPHPFKWSDRNFHFHPNPHGHTNQVRRNEPKDFKMVCYLISEVSHPHGIVHTPRSLLFGVDQETSGRINRLAKPYWGQNDLKYGNMFQGAELFIIFGCSLGSTDGWWWRKILQSVAENNFQNLLIYEFSPPGRERTREDVITHLILAAGCTNLDDAAIKRIDAQTVVLFHGANTPRAWLNTAEASLPEWALPQDR